MSRLPFKSAALAAVFVMIFGAAALAAEAPAKADPTKGDAARVAAVIKGAETPAEHVHLGDPMAEVEARLGKPIQTGKGDKDGGHIALWNLAGRSLSVEAGHDGRVNTYSIHWIGPDTSVPTFDSLIPPGFTVQTRRDNKQMVEMAGNGAWVRWTRMRVPERKLTIGVLTITSIPLTPNAERPR